MRRLNKVFDNIYGHTDVRTIFICPCPWEKLNKVNRMFLKSVAI